MPGRIARVSREAPRVTRLLEWIARRLEAATLLVEWIWNRTLDWGSGLPRCSGERRDREEGGEDSLVATPHLRPLVTRQLAYREPLQVVHAIDFPSAQWAWVGSHALASSVPQNRTSARRQGAHRGIEPAFHGRFAVDRAYAGPRQTSRWMVDQRRALLPNGSEPPNRPEPAGRPHPSRSGRMDSKLIPRLSGKPPLANLPPAVTGATRVVFLGPHPRAGTPPPASLWPVDQSFGPEVAGSRLTS